MKLSLTLASVLAIAGIQSVSAALGVDVSVATSQSAISCLVGKGYKTVIARAYTEAYGANPGGKVDTGAVTTYKNAIAAGAAVDVYLFPCTGRSTCKSPATQVSELAALFKNNGMGHVGTIWLDVEVDPSANNWPSATSNKATLTAFKTALNNSGLKWGIYSSTYQWQTITGSTSWVLDNTKPLWYAHYDNSQSFSDFSSFGGWTKPTIKQYSGSANVCGASVDLNYYG
ncbi:glycoside hydrolase [Hesseltinella vesiculosa]|uniref:Glycoside hydrolase n=1 Tax=Hesseltinella vesiculosa TaxID=101127 RepID=A0A1X2GBI6_9FUNG|nr:glycoside hydrolase [Hesseltinella vesiculosa]